MPTWKFIPKRKPKTPRLVSKEVVVQSPPTDTMYMLEATKATSITLKNLAGLVPAPGLSQFLELAIRIVEACESATAIEEDIEELRKRVVSLSILIANKVPSDRKINEDLQFRIKNLQAILTDIDNALNAIRQQWRWLLVLFPQLNKDRVNKCVRDLGAALESFDMSHRLQVEGILENILHNTIDVHKKIESMDAKLSEIVEAVKRPHTSPYAIGRQDMPPPSKIFFGRDGDVSEIVHLLSSASARRVCITASAGMGKTRLAVAVIHNPSICNIFGDYRFWVPCIKATTADALRRLLYTQLSITAESFDSLDVLINELKGTEDRRLILLDNFETPWESSREDDEISDILTRIAEIPHVALLVTMTSAFPPSQHIDWKHHHLHPLDALAAQKAFLAECPSLDLTGVDKLTSAVGYVPLAINLMARAGQGSRLPTEALLEDWNASGTGMLSGLDARIQRSIDLVRANDSSEQSALKLLANLSMLPLGTTMKNLNSLWATSIRPISCALSILRSKALIECDDGESGDLSRVHVIPTIQAFMNQHGLISDDVGKHVRRACQQFVLKHKFYTRDEPYFKDSMSALSEEHNNIEVLLLQEDSEDDRESLRAEALVAYCVYLYNIKPSVTFARQGLDAAKATKNRRCIAEAHEVLADMYYAAAQYDEGYRHYEEAHRVFTELQDFARAGECTYAMVTAWMFMGPPSDLELESLAAQAQAELSHDKNNEYSIARGILTHGYYLSHMNKHDDARKLLTEALIIFKRLDCPSSTATSLKRLARTEASSKNYQLALDLCREALRIAEERELGTAFIAAYSNLESSYLMALGSYSEAERSLHRSLILARSRGSFLNIAQVLEKLGYIYTKRKDPNQAIQFYTEAQIQYGKVKSESNGCEPKLKCERNVQALASGRTDGVEEPVLF